MVKIIKVESCAECKAYHYVDGYEHPLKHFCSHPLRRAIIEDFRKIDDNCPLEDLKEKSEGE